MSCSTENCCTNEFIEVMKAGHDTLGVIGALEQRKKIYVTEDDIKYEVPALSNQQSLRASELKGLLFTFVSKHGGVTKDTTTFKTLAETALSTVENHKASCDVWPKLSPGDTGIATAFANGDHDLTRLEDLVSKTKKAKEGKTKAKSGSSSKKHRPRGRSPTRR